jgi:hypothetical protein
VASGAVPFADGEMPPMRTIIIGHCLNGPLAKIEWSMARLARQKMADPKRTIILWPVRTERSEFSGFSFRARRDKLTIS